ncbi:hypothetical protein L1049_020450 [Liquidambar formosana]|uniref:Glycosyl hydrolase family 32 C-terminal domain-containing protein n=1 Tax=Liquidambar formosana TaxID=63359 RepID=A0AAP0X7C8_LIQFO
MYESCIKCIGACTLSKYEELGVRKMYEKEGKNNCIFYFLDAVLWFIWTARNDLILNGKKVDWKELRKLAISIPRVVVFDQKTKTSILQWPVEEVESLRLTSTEFEGVELAPGSSKASSVDKQVHGDEVPVLHGENLSMRLLVDHSVVESFAQGGRKVITLRIYPTAAVYEATQLFLFNNATKASVVASIKNHQGQGTTSGPLTESDRQRYKDEIERLKQDKGLLDLELERHEQEQHVIELQRQHLRERVQHIERREQTMISSWALVLQKPRLALTFVAPLETHNRKRRLLTTDCYHDEAEIDENRIGTSQAMTREDLDANSVLALNLDQFELLESSLISWENILHEVGQSSSEIMNLQQQSPGLNPSSTCSVDNNSSLELAESTSCVESSAISYLQLNVDVRSKSTGIDMNCKPTAIAPDVALTEQAVGTMATAPTGVNDVFWEQFLTENPGSSDTREAQSESKYTDGIRNESKHGDHGKFWWNTGTVNNLAEQMGQHTSAERT